MSGPCLAAGLEDRAVEVSVRDLLHRDVGPLHRRAGVRDRLDDRGPGLVCPDHEVGVSPGAGQGGPGGRGVAGRVVSGAAVGPRRRSWPPRRRVGADVVVVTARREDERAGALTTSTD